MPSSTPSLSAAPRARPSQPTPGPSARRAVSLALPKASSRTRGLFAAFTPRRSLSSPKTPSSLSSSPEADYFATLPVLLSGPAAAYVLAAEEERERAAAKGKASEVRVEWPENNRKLARTMSVWSVDSVDVEVKSVKSTLSRRRHSRNKSYSSIASTSTSARHSTVSSPAVVHRAPPTPPKTPNPSHSPRALDPDAPPLPPKTPRSARARTFVGLSDPKQPTFAEFLRELDPSLRSRAPVFATLPLSPPPTPPASTTPRSSRSSSVFKPRRSLRRSDSIPEEDENTKPDVPKLRTDVGRKDSPAKHAETQYWSPTLEAIDWSADAADNEKVAVTTGLGVGPMVSLEAKEGAASVDFPVLVATGAQAKHRRGISIQGKGREAKGEGEARATSGEARSWDFL